MYAGNLVGILFSFVLFIIGMIFSAKGMAFFVIGIIGLVCTVYFLVRIVLDLLKGIRKGNS